MKNATFLLITVLFIGTYSCGQSDTIPVKQQLFLVMKNDAAIRSFIDTYPYAYIAENMFCEGEACKTLLREIEFDIPVYSKEDAFMRKLDNSITILEINTSAEVPFLRFHLNGKDAQDESGMITL